MAKDPWSDWNDDDPGNFQPGDTIGPYELLFPAAVGGMAAVWAARLRRPNGSVQIVAVKLLSDAMRGDDDARAMFLDEACTASRILHPNVVHILAYGEVRDRPYLAMEWIDGAPIAKIFANQKAKRALLPLGWVLHVMIDACAGLHAAHEVRDDTGELLNLIHRDVTPENVMVTFDGMVKVVDFGVAKTRARAQISRVGAIKGKTGYFSPEQVMGGTLDRRSDLFSMGVLLYLLVTGHTPFRGKGPLEAMQQIANRNPQPPREIMPEVHPELDRIIMRALAKNPNERYQTAAELRRDLEQVSLAVRESYTDKQVGQLVRDLLPGVAEARKERIDQAIDELDRILAERAHPQKPQAARPEDATEVMLRRISMLPILQDGPESTAEGASSDAAPASSGPASSRMSGPASSRMSGPASSRMSGPASSRMSGPTSSRRTAADPMRKSNPDATRKSTPDATVSPLDFSAGLSPLPVGLPPAHAGPAARAGDPADAGASIPERRARPASRGSLVRTALLTVAILGLAAVIALLLARRSGRLPFGALAPPVAVPGAPGPTVALPDAATAQSASAPAMTAAPEMAADATAPADTAAPEMAADAAVPADAAAAADVPADAGAPVGPDAAAPLGQPAAVPGAAPTPAYPVAPTARVPGPLPAQRVPGPLPTTRVPGPLPTPRPAVQPAPPSTPRAPAQVPPRAPVPGQAPPRSPAPPTNLDLAPR
ncbi:protein kinase domain-containing protein [Sorangium sp. So ce854]|uniref:serine/threonine-protein kinase n=1 Tax=Sorangium sp. So ce854 TaxID=3133322 RepID=UPI003F5EEBD2